MFLELTPEWIERLAALGVVLRDPDENGQIMCYYNEISVGICTEDDPWAIKEAVAEGVPEEVVLAVSQLYNEAESRAWDALDD